MPSPGRQETACSGQDYYRPDRIGTVTVVAVLDCRDPQRCLAAGRGSLAEREVTLITQEPPSAASGPLLLADISGYTSFLQSVAVAHKDDAFADGVVPDAYEMMSDLMDGIVQRLVPPFTLSKLEGDAVFAYATDLAPLPQGAAMLDCIAECHADFRRRLDAAHGMWTCQCNACSRIDDLGLKFILHAGAFVIQEIAGRQELAGPEVVMAHRLLKSGAEDVVGHGAYALISAAAVTRFDIPTDAANPLVETYEYYSPIHAYVFPLQQG